MGVETDYKELWGNFWGDGNSLYLDRGNYVTIYKIQQTIYPKRT